MNGLHPLALYAYVGLFIWFGSVLWRLWRWSQTGVFMPAWPGPSPMSQLELLLIILVTSLIAWPAVLYVWIFFKKDDLHG